MRIGRTGMVRLWSINRWLRFTGFRLTIEVDEDPWKPTRIGLLWFGLPGSKRWRRIEGAK